LKTAWRGEFAIGAAELFEQHIAELGIGIVDPHGEHELLDMMVQAAL
jgi:hypothetical protein